MDGRWTYGDDEGSVVEVSFAVVGPAFGPTVKEEESGDEDRQGDEDGGI